MKTVLFVDDEMKKWIAYLSPGLENHGFKVIGEIFPEKPLQLIRQHNPDVVLLDIRENGVDKGRPILIEIKRKYPNLPVVMLTETLRGDVLLTDPGDFFSLGASYCFDKKDLDGKKYEDPYAGLARQLEKAIEDSKKDKMSLDEKFGFIIGTTPKMIKVAELIDQVAKTNTTVLIIGETGVGKEQVARSIHNNSIRKSNSFGVIECGTPSETTLESNLFGHEPGAFTDAKQRYIGIFERASGGTVFLDEVQDMPPNLQQKLLRVLQEGEIIRMKGTGYISVDVRIIGATNQDLEEKIKKGSFRKDLYYRLKVVEIKVPPLRERISDIPALYTYFINKFNEKLKKQISSEIRDDVREIFQRYPWPGNIRELENTIEQAMVMTDRTTVLAPSVFNLPSDTPGNSNLPIDVDDIVRQILEGKIKWKGTEISLTEHYKASPVRAEIYQKLAEAMTRINEGKKPTQKQIADKLGFGANYNGLRQNIMHIRKKGYCIDILDE